MQVASDPASLRDLLRRGLGELGHAAPEDRLGALSELALLLARWAARINLTGHRTPEAIVRRLVLDAAAMLCALPEFESEADLGSGAGFPGLPMAILAPGRRFLLVEARERRHHFQRAVIRTLGLRNATARLGRAESLTPVPCDLVVAQAMAQPERALRWMLPWAREQGWLAIPGSERPPDPGGRAALGLDIELRRYRVPLGGPARTLWLARRRS